MVDIPQNKERDIFFYGASRGVLGIMPTRSLHTKSSFLYIGSCFCYEGQR